MWCRRCSSKACGRAFSLLFKNKMLLLVTLANLLGALGFGANFG